MSEKLSHDEVAHLAMLARIAVTDDEITQYSEQLDDILAAVSTVSEADTADVRPMSHPHEIDNVTRPDVVRPGLTHNQAMSGAPVAEDGRFRVPRILEDPS